MTQNSSNSSKDLGNTKPNPSLKKRQISPSKRWCFTFNNYDSSVINELKEIVPICRTMIVGKEIGENNTPHLQGYIEFIKKLRPLSLKLNKGFHFEKSKGTKAQNVKYCRKEGNEIKELCFNIPRKLKLIKPEQFYYWQKDIIKTIQEEADDRTINWYWKHKGKMGKSQFTKYIVANYNCMILSNRACDMKNGILQYEKEKGIFPEIVIIDIPRSVNLEYVSYTGIEEIKNGCFFSPKYEGGMCLFNSPHIFIFSNDEPLIEKLSLDRWNIVKLNNESILDKLSSS